MANDNDFLNQKIIPAEENLGDHNNEHKQIVLYCPQGWHKQKGLSQGCQSHRQGQNQRMNNCPSLFTSSQNSDTFLCSGKVLALEGARKGLFMAIASIYLLFQSYSTAPILTQQN